ncbi:MAG: hypothetical protein HQK55_00020 [Deltaproteobacteria bacterium]|nr:hypothetical protein [Deltaproteobacteria bacterium]
MGKILASLMVTLLLGWPAYCRAGKVYIWVDDKGVTNVANYQTVNTPADARVMSSGKSDGIGKTISPKPTSSNLPETREARPQPMPQSTSTRESGPIGDNIKKYQAVGEEQVNRAINSLKTK